jgi:hypothetical protein
MSIQRKYSNVTKTIIKQELDVLSKNVKFYKYKDTRNPMYFISKVKMERFRNRVNNLSSVKIVEDSDEDFFVENNVFGLDGPKDKDFNMVEARYIANKLRRLEYEIESSIKELELEVELPEPNKNTCKYLNGYIRRKTQEFNTFKREKGL